MITKSYNPSLLEVEMAKVIQSLQESISEKLSNNTIKSITVSEKKDNPDLTITMEDTDGDEHIMILKIIQRPDVPLN